MNKLLVLKPIKNLETSESSRVQPYNLIIDKEVHFSLLSFEVRIAHSGHLPFWMVTKLTLHVHRFSREVKQFSCIYFAKINI